MDILKFELIMMENEKREDRQNDFNYSWKEHEFLY